MKRCPQCGREYDLTMSFCLDDGSELLYGPGTGAAVTEVYPAAEFNAEIAEIAETKILTPRSPRSLRSIETVEENSIAVLPFANISADEENEYFCDGLAEELLNALAKIEDLKVSARTSAFSFKGTNANVAEIGARLGVRTVLEGSVRKAGDRVRINVKLVNAADEYQLWSEQYDREMRNIFDVQDEITLAVVDALKLKLFGEQKAQILNKGTDNAEAFELYMRGRFFWNRRTIADFEVGIQEFERAIEIDPSYALAYSGLADCHLFLGYYEGVSPAEAGPKAKAAAAKALELDNGLAEAHASMGMYHVYFEFDWKRGEEMLLKAIELNPKLTTARYWYCSLLNALGRFDESIEQGRIALESDPLNLVTHGNVARAYTQAGRSAEGIAMAEKTLDISPDFFVTRWVLGAAYMETGEFDRAIEHLRHAADRSGLTFLEAYLGWALGVAGREDEARQTIGKLEEKSRDHYVSRFCFAAVHIGLGEKDLALECLEEAWEARTIMLMWTKTEPLFNAVRDEPRFKTLLERMDLA